MNECRRIKNRLASFIGGEMDMTEREPIERHLDSCPLCRQELKALEQILQAAESLNPEMEKTLASVDWEAQADKIVAAVWPAGVRPRLETRRTRFWPWGPALRPVLAGLLIGITIGGLAMFMVFKGRLVHRAGGEKLFASGEFLDRIDVEIARRETLDYLEKSQYVLLELAQSPPAGGTFKLSEAAARETRELLSKKKFLNPQLEKVRMAKAKDICDQIELLFYELAQLSDDLTPAQRQEIQSLIEGKSLLLKIKLLKKELQESEV